jgi:hypothetical protein
VPDGDNPPLAEIPEERKGSDRVRIREFHLSLGDELTKYMSHSHDDLAAKYCTLLCTAAMNTMPPPARLKYTARTSDDALNIQISSLEDVP